MFVFCALCELIAMRTCVLEIKDEDGNPATFNLLGTHYHAHLLGREMYGELLKVEK